MRPWRLDLVTVAVLLVVLGTFGAWLLLSLGLGLVWVLGLIP